MNEILNLALNDMAQTEFDCSCGRHHNFSIHDIAIGKGAITELPRVAEPFKDGKVLLIYDNHTYQAAGKRALALLQEAGFKNIKELLFDTGDDVLIPDEKTLGRILMEQDLDCDVMIAVGSGVLNDSTKFVSSRTHVPYIICCTAPSMDGYVADGAPIIKAGVKLSPLATLAYGVVGDTDIMKDAPMDLIHAGFGDVVGKITALADWDLSVKINDEYRCDTCVELVRRALDKCFSKATELKERNEDAILYLIEALTLTGVAMGLVNISRPASGAEHMLSHYWEMDFIARGLTPNHHGTQVGVATPIIAEFFEELSDILPEGTGEMCPPRTEIEALLRSAGCPVSPVELNISRELFYNSLIGGYKVRPRFSIMEFAKNNGRLEAIAQKITNRIYGEA
ncbi:MAG: sn-glycerol-1-phosphate dehydrogenase, partial [Eubacterium aggregans]|uniref:sn-glycerol-1-phosphate dehydrogenase n=1 Tax=Eubacterium aggregans TaxID=81409 RepID=UPI0023F51A4F|nr:sn-glycerol-1-phosphate dehydrogenase [Eubacterium aggregans]MDD4692327.1 sn-glycerol-1-phosphate dehydrogenase [Eubacterium aggregans]MEA5073666.1 sn-glycerol-1-phosphate dehydrogenase [Eubacterium aggregans]